MISEDYLSLLLEDSFGPLAGLTSRHEVVAQFCGAPVIVRAAPVRLEHPPHIPPCHARSRRADPVFAHGGASRTEGFARW